MTHQELKDELENLLFPQESTQSNSALFNAVFQLKQDSDTYKQFRVEAASTGLVPPPPVNPRNPDCQFGCNQLTEKANVDEEFKKLQEEECSALHKTIRDQGIEIAYLKAALKKSQSTENKPTLEEIVSTANSAVDELWALGVKQLKSENEILRGGISYLEKTLTEIKAKGAVDQLTEKPKDTHLCKCQGGPVYFNACPNREYLAGSHDPHFGGENKNQLTEKEVSLTDNSIYPSKTPYKNLPIFLDESGISNTPTIFADQLHAVLSELEAMLLQKNAAYGDSALNPARIFSRSEPDELIRVRIDDKLTRIKNRKDGSDDEDPEEDLLGYQVLLKIFKRFYRK